MLQGSPRWGGWDAKFALTLDFMQGWLNWNASASMVAQMKNNPYLAAGAVGFFALCVTACANLPDSVAQLAWQDGWGDRGSQVFARDYDLCATLVEGRRSLMAGCLASRGWSLGSSALP